MLKRGTLTGDLRSFLTGEETTELGERFLVLVHTNDRVFFSLERAGELSESLKVLSADSLKEFRAFSESGELHIWKDCSGIGWRLRIDEPSESGNTIDDVQFLWGNTIACESDEGLILKESGRGFSFRVPFFERPPSFKSESSLPLKLLVRNYFDFDEDGLLRFFDARLVSLKDKEGREVEWRL